MPLAKIIFKGKHAGTVFELFLRVCVYPNIYTRVPINVRVLA